MTALDFLLYDNRTWSPRWGRDWGIKAATGALADHADLRAAFGRYCGSLPSDRGHLSGFGAALGGVRPATGDGYLLCVTLETSDAFGRPSWAVFGLWCPDRPTLVHVLESGDPVGSARDVLHAATPPAVLEIRDLPGASPRAQRWNPAAAARIHRFDRETTVRDVTSTLLGAAYRKSVLPNVLGITAVSRLSAFGSGEFAVVYSHPLDERAEQALARVGSPPPVHVDEPAPPLDDVASPVPILVHAERSRSPGRRDRRPVGSWKWWWVSLATVILVALLLLPGHSQHDAPPPQDMPTTTEAAANTAAASGGLTREPRREDALRALAARVEEWRRLSVKDLRSSPGFVAAEIPVLPEHEGQREQVRQAYDALLAVRERMVKGQGNYVAYYFDEGGRGIDSAVRLQKVAEILAEGDLLGGNHCAVLASAFRFELETPDSVLRQWCNALVKLEQTAATTLAAARREQAPARRSAGAG